MQRLQSIVREDAAAAKIEFALSAMVLLMVLFGVMEVARAGYCFHFVSYAAQQGTRYATVRGASWGTSCSSATSVGCTASQANVQSFIQGLAVPGITAGNITVTPSWPGKTLSGSTTGCSNAKSAGCLVQVKVSYSFNFIMAYMPQSAIRFTGTSEAVIQR